MIIYSEEKEQRARDVAVVFKNSGIKRPFDDYERIQKMIDNSDVMITAWFDGKMIGVARAITDFSYCCYLSDLAVDKRYQKHGIGTELVKRIQSIVGDECSMVLLSAPGAVEYYPRLGFENSDKAFVIKRKK
ncbi:putative N-acetyltransferase YhbS [Paenibacillus anaericanus]|uniref:GNAT family N-acetyltransferase n=1 Tax=Paenibacillus anaericanus TaxID=170367 RepID=UPI00277FC750|nr:GNAT family N-acetyltransferase [Paenibacillus anaericanus]MDQ0088579.1 putative N-acetyltransferase YhbS [Paenibacillus anaericanus]